ncbi:hypothetical protein [Limnoglobus roseus]|uniref:Uncharacterized protein n=1 Tax=Limnoglobus roseus TaxID=2598579 RepID=A0A5C1AQN2_9BACT|nr:hypothetical protein [Limnoglobus roseus]QEL19494.1 hypothetical protein PX52LOC_06568 [Limnoglobus roseus]
MTSLLGLGSDGQKLGFRPHRKHVARMKARFVVDQVQATMGLEAQGLRAAKDELYHKTVGRILAKNEKMW